MKNFVAVTAIAVAICVASPAVAQDEPVADASSPFSGFSVAVIGGVDALTIQENDAADSTRDLLYGASAGYDQDVGNVVLGVQAEYSDSSASFEIDDLLVAGDQFTSAAGRNIYGGVRIGMHAGDNALVYIGGGYVDSKLTSRYTDGTGTIEQSETKGGFRVSLGGEIGRETLFGRLELRYQDLGDYNVFGFATGFARTNTQIVAGVGARF
jgi:outer membrane immunogenic protein